MSYSILSLFAGAGGFDLGFHKAGFNTVWANEWNGAAAQTWRNAMGDAMHHGDIVEFMKDGLPDKGAATVVIGGPPCQGFSQAGKMDPNDPRSRHVFNYMEIVRRIQPRVFVMENVAALCDNPRWGGTKHDLLRIAGEMGYKVQVKVLTASHYDTPQRRRRAFFVGVKQGQGLRFQFPEPTTKDKPPTVREAFAALPRFGELGNDIWSGAIFTPRKRPMIQRNPYRSLLFNGNSNLLNPEAPSPTLTAAGGAFTPYVDQGQLDNPGQESWMRAYQERLLGGGPGEVPPPGTLRRITLAEGASIQTFPKDMPWSGGKSAVWRQIGNAVPVNLAWRLGEAVKACLDGTTPMENHPLFEEE